MISSIVINRRILGSKNNPKSKPDTIITSTPIKKKTLHQMEMEWLSPVEKSSNKSPNPHILIQENGKLDKIAEAESVDKICLGNHFLETSNDQEVPALNNVDVEPKIKKIKQLIVMDSDEEEIFWLNRNKPLKRKKHVTNGNARSSTDAGRLTRQKKTQEEVGSITTEPIVEATAAIDAPNRGSLLPNNTVDSSKAVHSPKKRLEKILRPAKPPARKNDAPRSKSASKILKNLTTGESLKDSDRSTITVTPPLNKKREQVSTDDKNTVRKSNRQRCKPLEFWNGQRMNVGRDFTIGIEKTVRNKKKLTEINVEKVQRSKIEQVDQIPTNTPNLANTHELKSSLAKKSETSEKKGSILKSRTSTRSKANVTFSAIGSGTTIDGPTSEKHMKTDWMVNFTGLHSAKEPLPDSENCLIFPGLNTLMGIISSAIIHIRPQAINQNQAPDLHHLMFCVMVGTVTVTINETSVEMKTYGHFAVPCGVSYSIENIGKKKATLSFFKVACRCVGK